MKRINLFPLFGALACFCFFPYRITQVISLIIIALYGCAFLFSRMLYYSVNALRLTTHSYCYNGAIDFSKIIIKNRGLLPLDTIIVQDTGIGTIIETVLMRSQKILAFKINTRKRGVNRIGPIYIYGSDPFNFFPWVKTIQSFCDIVTYPRFHPISLILKEGERGGSQKVVDPLYEDLSNLQSMRDYRLGDSLKRINWKASAKAETLQTMEFSNTLSAPIFLLLDINPDDYPLKQRQTLIERSIEATASLLSSFNEKKEACGLFSYTENGTVYFPLKKGHPHLVTIFEHLSNMKFSSKKRESIVHQFLTCGIVLPEGTHLYILTPCTDANLYCELTLLHRKKFQLHLVHTGEAISPQSSITRCKRYTLTGYGKEYVDEL